MGGGCACEEAVEMAALSVYSQVGVSSCVITAAVDFHCGFLTVNQKPGLLGIEKIVRVKSSCPNIEIS